MDTEQDAEQTVKVLGLEFPVLYDTDGAVARSWGIYNLLGDGVATPSTYVYDATGALRAFRIGKDAADRPSPAEVLDVIRSFEGEGAAGKQAAFVLTEGAEFGACAVPDAGATGTPAASSCDNAPPRASVTPAPPTPASAPALAPLPTATPFALGPGLSDFTLPDAGSGASVKLSSYLGKKNIVLVFYRAYW